MSEILESCRTKLGRAKEHFDAFHESMDEFIDLNPYGVRIEADPHPGAYRWLFKVYPRLIYPIPQARWAVLIGEIVYQFRSALDQLVWGLSEMQTGAPPPGPLVWGDRWRGVAFPICERAEDWPRIRDRCLWGVDPTLHAMFESVQPFQSDPKETDPLWLLNELCNIDKHRFPHLTGLAGAPYDPHVSGPTAWDVVESSVGPLQEDTALLVIGVSDPWNNEPEMYVDLGVTIYPAFPSGYPGFGRRVDQLLPTIGLTVGGIIDRFPP